MRAYGTQHSNRQIKYLPIPSGGRFAKFNARQSFPLYRITVFLNMTYQRCVLISDNVVLKDKNLHDLVTKTTHCM